ncbi:hypothetical protein LY78DRAFT_11921 [Colletotrichum sublineola]|uniref:BTB domain-containing protein n=1 Tax=Colletotrichum sublineola TaxID=1173701 RepID=A0A066Y2B1_COLSU|nr:hypothetical protein LY78DRAFT_11921 [Colletotrichum sublineola]KDN72360.1 hypothetical protein CSUB01_00043 [Colletotrichum sublineola]
MVDEIAHVVDPGGDVVLVLRNPKAPFAVWKDFYWEPQPKTSKKDKKKKKKKKRHSEPIPGAPDDEPAAEPVPAWPDDEPIAEAPFEESVPEPAEEPMPEPAIHEIERPSIGFGSVEGSQPAQDAQSDEESEVKFLLSSRHLILASRYFNAKLNGTWKEATRHAIDRRYHLEASDWDSDALLILMNIIHGRTRSVPRRVDCEMLAKIAVLVDYYDCHEVVEVFASMWIDALKDQLPSECSRDLVLWLLIAHVFQHDIFAKVTKTAVLAGRGPMPTMDLPIPPIVADLIDWRRQDAIGFILDSLNALQASLRSGLEGCSHECSCMNLGALDKQMHQENLLGLSEPYPGQSITGLETIVRGFSTPSWGSGWQHHPNGCTLDMMIKSRLDSEFEKNKEGFSLAEVAMSDVSRREGR